jgi:hypothetical protein
VADCWRLRRHFLAERYRIRRFRHRGDLWMLRFLRWRLNRWDEVQRMRRFGLPKVGNSALSASISDLGRLIDRLFRTLVSRGT